MFTEPRRHTQGPSSSEEDKSLLGSKVEGHEITGDKHGMLRNFVFFFFNTKPPDVELTHAAVHL